MKNIFFVFLLFCFIYPQIDYGINYELKYTNGEIENTDIFENYFDINLYFNDFYFYTLFRYKDPALIGMPTKNIDDMFDIFYLDYSIGNIQLQLGDIFQSYGSGLSMHSFEDRGIDYNNSPRGAALTYYFTDNIDIFATVGKNTFNTRTNPAVLEPNIYIDNELFLGGFSYRNDYLDIFYLSMLNNQFIDSETILSMQSLNNFLGKYLSDRYLSSGPPPLDFNMKVLEHNFGSTFYLDNLELYFEKSWVYYNKINDERISGYKYYFSSYFSLSDYGILYEYKNYNTPYYFSVYSNPPIVFKENSSTLISRNLHNVDFSNEVGHHILINKSYSEQLNLVLSSAFAYRHLYDDSISEPKIGSIIKSMLKLKSLDMFLEDLKPYRQFYAEINGMSKNEKIFYKLGLDDYAEYAPAPDKKLRAKTFTSQFTFKNDSGNSVACYLEYQKMIYLHLSPNEIHRFAYLSPSYNHYGKWILSLFYDIEYEINNAHNFKEGFMGMDITYFVSDSNILSIFLGSQKGGLVCANGTCVMQPDFENGFKITSKIIF